MPPIPDYLIIVIVVCVIIPAIAAILLRLKLYQHLVFLQKRIRRLIRGDSRGEQPKIIEDLEQRFQQARRNLEQVNTTALIEQVYSQEKIWIFTCEEIDYFCRILPNLLLIFGLFGTFLGITINLTSLSQTINQTNSSDINGLVSELKTPLQGMSIAFTTSLAAIICSAFLTVFNSIRNTSLAKYKLLSSLEDYLDNVYQPQIPGASRLDIIVNRMVSQQDEFLSRFGVTVRDAVESSMGNVAKQIAEGNREVTQLATQVYQRFTEAAGTISGAANEFEHAIQELTAKANIFTQAADTFERSKFPEKLSTATENLAHIQNLFAQSAGSLAETATSIDTAVTEMKHCSQELIILATEIKSVNQTSVQVLELHQSNQTSLGEIIPQLKQGANSFAKNSNKLDKLEKRIGQRVDSLNSVIESLTQLLTYVKSYTDTVESSFSSCSQELIGLVTEIKSVNQTSIQVLELHQTNQTSLAEIIPQLSEGAQNFATSSETIDNLEQRVGERVDSLNGVIESLTQLLTYVESHSDTVESSVNTLTQKIINFNQTFLQNMQGYFNQFGIKFDTFKVDYEELFQTNNVKIIEGYRIVGERMIAVIREQTEQENSNLRLQTDNYQNLMSKLEECINQLGIITEAINNLKTD
ncbi:MAG: hypothetical protein QNJ63_26490 [Calothrix sp. MO_192.B10]|nr:hypothetical protein [Calothrix sp. MO_192.B10]